MKTPEHTRGFTLIELLIALAIFALVSVMTFTGLNTVLDARERTEAEAMRLVSLQKTFAIMRRDLESAVSRRVRDQFGDYEPAFELVEADNSLRFTRGGRENPLLQQRSSLERIGYGLDDEGRLIRTRWRTLDQPIEPELDELVLLEDVESFQLRFLDPDQEWQDFWPPATAGAQNPDILPRAVEVELEVEPYGRIRRLFLLPF